MDIILVKKKKKTSSFDADTIMFHQAQNCPLDIIFPSWLATH